MKDISSYISNKFFLSHCSSKILSEIMDIVSFEKGTNFVEKDRENKMEYWIVEGICRSYFLDNFGAEITLSFFTPNKPVSPNVTRTNANHSILNLQAITNVRLLIFRNEDLMNLMKEHKEIEVWANAVLQGELQQKVAKEINQNSMNAKERLIDFRDQYSSLENLIPHSYISSYLGITNVSLSRIRKEIARNYE